MGKRFVWAGILICAGILVQLLGSGCRVTVYSPAGPAPTSYFYDLAGEHFLRTIRVDYDPGDPDSRQASVSGIPPGVYRLLEDGQERCSFRLRPGTRKISIHPDSGWPVALPSGRPPADS